MTKLQKTVFLPHLNFYIVNALVKDMENKLNEHQSSIALLKSLGAEATSNGKPGFIEALKEMIDGLRKEIYGRFVEKDDFKDIVKRVDELEY